MWINLGFKGKEMEADHKTTANLHPATEKSDKHDGSQSNRTLLPGGGEMGERIREFDWSMTPLGAIESWSLALLTTVRIMLANRFPILLWWGPQYICLYNDAYIPVLGKKHPWALGQPGSECWKEIWHILQPLVDTPFTGGPATWNDDIFLELNRYGFLEETHFTIAYSPVPDATLPSGIGGVLATVHEITEKVIGERRIVVLRDLGTRVGDARTADDACLIVAETLTAHDKDIPFALLYLIDSDGKQARLAGAAGVPMNEEISPLVVDLDVPQENGWPLAAAWQTESIQVLDHLDQHFRSIPSGPWSDPPHTAAVLSIPSNKSHEPAGLLVLGISARLKFDQLYKDFIELVRTQVATAIANARVYEEERRRAEDLAEIDRTKTAFFANISHEFRTPLTLMMGPLEDALSDADGLSVINRERLELTHRNALRQLKLVNTLLDFSRIEAGRVQAVYEPVDLGAYTEELASVFRSAIEHAGLRLIVNCETLDEPVYIDRDMWEKIVLNLLSNAFKFTFEGEIEISLRQVGNEAQLAVRDTGVGIPSHELPHMFERFHRIRGTKSRSHEGTGIGLALVQELVQLHGGRIEVASLEDKGTIFTISIPLGTSHLPADRIGAARTMSSTSLGAEPYIDEIGSWLPQENYPFPNGDGAWSLAKDPLSIEHGQSPISMNRSRILLVDDNSDVRRYIQRLLEQNHFQVEAVADGLLALRAARDHTPDLVLTDVMIPGLDGFALLRELRANQSTAIVPVIMLSARAGEEARVEGMEAGADDYLIKPFAARELMARVKAHLEIARIRNESRAAMDYRSAQYETLLNQAPLGVYVVDADFRIRDVNPTALPVFGNIPNLIGRDFDEVIHLIWAKEYADELVRIFRHTLETGESHETSERSEYRVDRKVTEYYEWRLDRIVLPDGRYGVVCYFRDISNQVQARVKIAESEERYRGIVNQSVGGIAEADATGRFITVNDHCCKITGYTREEMLNLRMQDLTHPEDRSRSLELLNRLIAGGEPYEIEKRYIRKDGSVIWIHKSVSAIRDLHGKVQSLIAILIDITKSKQTEETLQQLNLELEILVERRTAQLVKANQALKENRRRLIDVQEEERRAIARELHDRVGQSLTAVNLNLSIIRDQLSGQGLERVGNRLSDSINLLEETIPAVRDLMSNLRPALLDDYGLVTALKTHLNEFSTRYGIRVNFKEPALEIPPLSNNVEITLLRIAQEAMFNIAKHAYASDVRVSLTMDDSFICLTVQDNGVGMDSLEPYSRTQSHGLAIMRERAEAVGGIFVLSSEPRKGTKIEVNIPVTVEAGNEIQVGGSE